MALASTILGRPYSLGPVKQQLVTITAASGDTTGTIAVTTLHQITSVQVSGGMVLTAAPSISGTTITLNFAAAPAAGLFGIVTVHGV